jgi:hypothetical protein
MRLERFGELVVEFGRALSFFLERGPYDIKALLNMMLMRTRRAWSHPRNLLEFTISVDGIPAPRTEFDSLSHWKPPGVLKKVII